MEPGKGEAEWEGSCRGFLSLKWVPGSEGTVGWAGVWGVEIRKSRLAAPGLSAWPAWGAQGVTAQVRAARALWWPQCCQAQLPGWHCQVWGALVRSPVINTH